MTNETPSREPDARETSHAFTELPVNAHKAEIMAAIRANQVVVICGETGSGKTTQIPKICLELNRGTTGLIGCTQPRRVAAVTVAERVAQELGSQGNLVGWQHRFTRNTSSDNRIKFMTDGILLAEIRDNPLLSNYDTIMVDEAHERTLNIDFILGCLKRILPRRRDLKVIVSSATLETSRFSEFFNNAPVINIPGRTYPVDVRYHDIGEDADLAKAVADSAEEALNGPVDGDILVFLPGERDIRAAAETLRGRAIPYTAVIPLMASLPSSEQKRAFQTIQGIRRIILSTNVAETSVTIPGIRYVIDSGLARISRYDHRDRVKRLHIEAISKASAEQRKGRCGRIGPGICIRLYAEDDLQKRSEYTDPEIRRTSLAGLILSMFDWRLGDLSEFPFLQPPASSMIREGYKELLELGAIRENDPLPDGTLPRYQYAITSLGRQIVQLPLDPRLSRMLLAADSEHSVRDALTVVSALSCEDPLVRPADKLEEANRCHAKFKTEKSDFAGILLLWRFFNDPSAPLSRSAMRRRCADNFIAFRKLCEWEDVRSQLERYMKSMKIDPTSTSDSDIGLHKALLTGLLSNLGMWDQEAREYRGANGIRFTLFPGSCLYKKPPQWIMSAELVDTSRLYARRAASINPEWIEPAARHIAKYNYHAEYWDAKVGTARAIRKVLLFGMLISDGVRCDLSKISPEFARAMFIRQGLVDELFPIPIPKFVSQNFDLMGKRLAAAHKTRSADPDADKEEFIALYEKRLPAKCVNVPALRSWLSRATAAEVNQLVFNESDFDTPADDAAGFPDQVLIAGHRFNLKYRHNLGGEDDGITCTLTMQEIPLIRLWHSDWLVPGALHDKVVYLMRQLSRATLSQIADALRSGIKVRDIEAIADLCIEAMDRHIPLSLSLARMLSRTCRVGVEMALWGESEMPEQFVIRWRIVDEKHHEVFVSRSKAEIFEFYRELKALDYALATANTDFRYGDCKLIESSGIQSLNFPTLPETLTIGHAGSPIIAFPALRDDGDSVSVCLYATEEAARASHPKGILRLIMISEKISSGNLARSMVPSAKSTSNQTVLKQGFHALPSAAAMTAKPASTSRLPKQPDASRDLLIGALNATFLAGNSSLPRSPEALASLMAARRSKFSEILRQLSALIDAILRSAEDSLKTLDDTPNLPDESADDIAEQIGWLVFPGFAGLIPLSHLLEYSRYLNAILVRLERGNLDPAKERKKMQLVHPIWARHTAFVETLATRPPYNKAALDEHRWLVEELRVSTWAQELHTSTPVSPQRLNKLWDSVFIYG